jgi:hypothetical protein
MIHGIQYIPFTPISEVLLRKDWIRESYPIASANLGNIAPCWQQVMMCSFLFYSKWTF